ncbi:hypothetical protein VPH35_131579 [Triticum aestivum]
MVGEGRPAGPLASRESQPQHYDEQQLDDRQFDELCQRYGPSHISVRLAAAPAVAEKTVLEIRFDKGYPQFSDGTSYNGVELDDETKTASGAESRMRKKLARAV